MIYSFPSHLTFSLSQTLWVHHKSWVLPRVSSCWRAVFVCHPSLLISLYFGEGRVPVTGRTGTVWRVVISHVCSCACASWLPARLQMAQYLSIGLGGNTRTNSWPHGHGKWTRLNLQTRVPMMCMDFSEWQQLQFRLHKILEKWLQMGLSVMRQNTRWLASCCRGVGAPQGIGTWHKR